MGILIAKVTQLMLKRADIFTMHAFTERTAVRVYRRLCSGRRRMRGATG